MSVTLRTERVKARETPAVPRSRLADPARPIATRARGTLSTPPAAVQPWGCYIESAGAIPVFANFWARAPTLTSAV